VLVACLSVMLQVEYATLIKQDKARWN